MCIKNRWHSGMVWLDLQVGPQELLPGWSSTPPRRLYCHKDHVQSSQGLGVVAAQHPPFVSIVLIEQTKTYRVGFIAAASPGLKGYVLFVARLAIKVKPIEDERAILRIKDSTELLCRFTALCGVEDIGDVQISGAN